MNASETVWACLGVATGLLLIATYGWDAWHKGRTDRRFQRTARQAARTETTVAEDVAAEKRRRQQVEAAEDLSACLAIWNTTPHDIPHQTRRTEEDR
ncbi:hypothetical protein OG592_27270 [Streptomyces avidinii]|uniref:hypothetical protein n=1 Tax=Streptomyces avidinii TaxID=1895 RepID=UPI00386ABBCA|nr:hypothetical protein OG592_27270 [Streptomyces avidinii]